MDIQSSNPEEDKVATAASAGETPAASTSDGIAGGAAKGSESQEKLFTKDFVFISIVNFCFFTGFQMTLVGMPVYIAELGGVGVVIGLATTINTIAAVAIRPIAGMLLDRFGRKGILIFGVLLMIGAFIAFVAFPLIAVILAFRAVQGIGWGLSSTATSTIAADLIPQRRFAEGMGYYSLTQSFSSAVAPALGVQLIHDVGGSAMVAVALGLTLVGLGLLLAIKVKNPMPDAGSDDAVGGGEPGMRKKGIELSDMFDRRALFPMLATVVLNIGFTTINTFIVLHAESRGIDNVSLYFLTYAITLILTRPGIGKIIDRKGFFWPAVLSAASVAITLLIISVAQNLVVLCLAGVFAGLGLGTSFAVFQTMAVAAVPPQRRGVATSTFLFGLDSGIALGALVGGFVAGFVGYANTFIIMAVFPLIVLVMVLVVGKERLAVFGHNDSVE